MRKKLKFKKMLNEFRSLNYELQYIKEVLKDSHIEFELFYKEYCRKNDIDLTSLNKKNEIKIKDAFSRAVVPKIKEKLRSQERDHKDLYKDIAKKLHPDKLDVEDPRFSEYEEDFKVANNAVNYGQWGELFDIADKHNIDITDYNKVIESLSIDIKRIKVEINKQKTTYSWKLFNCDDSEKCKENVVKRFLEHLFDYKKLDK